MDALIAPDVILQGTKALSHNNFCIHQVMNEVEVQGHGQQHNDNNNSRSRMAAVVQNKVRMRCKKVQCYYDQPSTAQCCM
jgi:hypothetical protein